MATSSKAERALPPVKDRIDGLIEAVSITNAVLAGLFHEGETPDDEASEVPGGGGISGTEDRLLYLESLVSRNGAQVENVRDRLG